MKITGVPQTDDALANELAVLRARVQMLEQSDQRRQQAEEALRAQARQQAAVAEIGQRALAGHALQQLLDDAAVLVAETLNVEFCEVLELLPDQEQLLLSAGVGWRAGLVGSATVGAGVGSHGGYTLLSREPVIVEDLAAETRFQGSPLLREHGVVSGISAIIYGSGGRPFGVLGAHTAREHRFRKDHVHFLQAVANVLAAVIERRGAEEGLAESEERFRALVELAPDVVFSVTVDTLTITALNPAFESITGWSRVDWLGQSLIELVHPDDQARARKGFARIRRGETVGPVELRTRAKSGDYIVGEFRMAPKTEDGSVVEAFGIARDVSERKAADEELRRSRDELAIILGGVADGITVQDRSGALIYANDTAARLIGFDTADELLATPVEEFMQRFEVFDADGRPYPLERLPGRAALRGRPIRDTLVRFRIRATGEDRWSIVRAAPGFDASGSVQFAINIFHDISNGKRAEQRLAVQYAVSRLLADSDSLDEAGPLIVQAIGEGFGFDLGALWLMDADAQTIRCRYFWQAESIDVAAFEAASRAMAFTPGSGLPGRVWASGAPTWIPDVQQDANFPRAQYARRVGIHAAFAFPVRLGDAVLGVIEILSRQVRHADEDLLQTVDTLGSQIGQFSERKRAEAAAREGDARKGAILETALDAIISMDHVGRIVEFNPAAERMFGYARDAALGRDMADLIIPPTLREQHRAGLAQYLATGSGPILGQRIEMVGLRADGSHVPVELAITRIPLDGPATFTGYVRDISERKRAEQRARILAESTAVLLASLDPQTTIQNLLRLALAEFGDFCLISTVAEDGSIVPFADAHADPSKAALVRDLHQRFRPDPNQPGLGEVIRSGRAMVRNATPEQIYAAALYDEQRRLLEQLQPASLLAVPLVGRGAILGGMMIVSSELDRFTADDLAVAEELGRRAALALDNARLFRDAQQAATRVQALAEATQTFTEASLDLQAVLDTVARCTAELIGDQCVIRLLSEDKAWLDLAAVYHPDPEARARIIEVLSTARQRATEGLIGRVVQSGQPLLIPVLEPDVAQATIKPEHRRYTDRTRLHSVVAVPLRVHGEMIGSIGLGRETAGRPYTADDLVMLQDLADRAALAIDNARLYREAQDAIQRKDETLALLDTLLTSAPIGLGFWDKDLRYLRINETLAAINGLPVEAHLNRTLAEILPELAPAIEPAHRQVLETGVPIIANEVSGRTPATGDELRHWLSSYYPVLTADGQTLGIGVVVMDITERKRAEEERGQLLESEREAREAAQEAARLRQEFLSIASHELKTPLTSVKAAAQLLDRRLRQPDFDHERMMRLVGHLQNEVGRLEVLVSDLLDASRIQQGRLELRPASVDLADLAVEVLDRFEHASERGEQHQLVLDAPAPVVGIWDPARIVQVLTNLISNALKYSPQGGTVRVSVRRAAGCAEVAVTDQGVGIAYVERERLFQPFSRGDDVRHSVGGTGLGLYISAQIVAQHAGSITVESEPGQGSTFTVSLPLGGSTPVPPQA